MKNISIKNILVWFCEQLTHPTTLFERSTWGVFSRYSHYRRSDLREKVSHATKVRAVKVANEMKAKYGGEYVPYKCVYCDGWHVAKVGAPANSVAVNVVPAGPLRVETAFDVQRILSTGIKDIAVVYGGVRGATMSSPRQEYAWPIIHESGIRTIIDLREDGFRTRLSLKCEQYGMRYFHYPVDNRCNNIESMVRLLPELCRCIDEGNFYIACAMGLHRTDIALSVYWVFYAADRNVGPPEIRGYHAGAGHNTSKIMRVLNCIYSYMTEHNGLEPMPEQEFIRRKDIIKRQSKI